MAALQEEMRRAIAAPLPPEKTTGNPHCDSGSACQGPLKGDCRRLALGTFSGKFCATCEAMLCDLVEGKKICNLLAALRCGGGQKDLQLTGCSAVRA